MEAQDIIKRNKTLILSYLCEDYLLILNKVLECELVTKREYNNLKEINKETTEGHVNRLVDKMINKGPKICQKFLELFKNDEEIRETFPGLKDIAMDSAPPSPKRQRSSSLESDPIQESTQQTEDERYKLTSKPTGLCLIINNENFVESSARPGTDKDAESLARVFSQLGFVVVTLKDLTKDQMVKALKIFASSMADLHELRECNPKIWSANEFADLTKVPQHGDAFVCCLLSHGSNKGVYGTDGQPLPISEIWSPFNGKKCSALIGKPKVFFIQACQGKETQDGVATDCPQLELQSDAVPFRYIPVGADCLVAVATEENFVSFRSPTEGTWFIQSLCAQLQKGCERGDDIMTILCRVNNEVSQKEGNSIIGMKKQMPDTQKNTLRKKLVFPFVSSSAQTT